MYASLALFLAYSLAFISLRISWDEAFLRRLPILLLQVVSSQFLIAHLKIGAKRQSGSQRVHTLRQAFLCALCVSLAADCDDAVR